MRQRQSPLSRPGGSQGGDLCEIRLKLRPCGRAAVAAVSVTCPNEEADTRRLCAEHTRDAQQGVMVCTNCLEAGRGSHTVLVTRVRWGR